MIIDYNQVDIWSSGVLTKDVEDCILNLDQLNKDELTCVLKKIGDISGCPIPDLVAKRMGTKQAIKYLCSLVCDYNLIKDLLDKNNVPWKAVWGKQESRKPNEPAGEYSSRIPNQIIEKKIVRGPGKYHEFSITRLLWFDKCNKNLIQKQQLNDLILKSESIVDFHVRFVIMFADLYKEIDNLTEILMLGVAHEGFFKQNNCFLEVKDTLNKIKNRAESENWFLILENDVNQVFNSSTTI